MQDIITKKPENGEKGLKKEERKSNKISEFKMGLSVEKL